MTLCDVEEVIALGNCLKMEKIFSSYIKQGQGVSPKNSMSVCQVRFWSARKMRARHLFKSCLDEWSGA